jgi:hypothetical protein
MNSKERWIVGAIEAILFIIIISFVITINQKVNQVITAQQKLDKQLSVLSPLLEDSSMSSVNNLALRRMINSLNSIERFVRTTPLVECGNWNDRQQQKRAVLENSK